MCSVSMLFSVGVLPLAFFAFACSLTGCGRQLIGLHYCTSDTSDQLHLDRRFHIVGGASIIVHERPVPWIHHSHTAQVALHSHLPLLMPLGLELITEARPACGST